MAPDAPASVIRESYRARARLHHPDRGDHTSGGVSMAAINEAYRVLKDPGRRAVYDRSLTAGSTTSDTRDSRVADEPWAADEPLVRRRRPNPLSPDGPARYPWKGMLVLGLVGSVLVLVSAAMTDPPSQEVPDGILRTDSCVSIEPNGDVREIACTGDDDIVVELLIPTDARCPAGMTPFRDRLGLGTACIIP